MNWRNFITVVSVMILVGTEVFGVALAGAWAIAGLFELGDTAAYVLMGLFGLLAIYALLALWRHSTAIEPIRS
jgi:predicted membrane channel-forming protein YqfA (hemolysin III family)